MYFWRLGDGGDECKYFPGDLEMVVVMVVSISGDLEMVVLTGVCISGDL